MNFNDFRIQMDRLANAFGAHHYKEERVKLIWKEVQFLDALWLARVVDKFIGELRQAPLLLEFRTEISAKRETDWKIDKAKESNEIKQFMSKYTHDDESMIIKTIVKRASGQVNDQEWEAFQSMLKNIANSS